MSYPRFKELIELSIKMQAATNLMKITHEEAKPLLTKMKQIYEGIELLRQSMKENERQIYDLEKEAQHLINQLVVTKDPLKETSITEKLDILSQKKLLIQCEFLYNEAQLLAFENSKNSLVQAPTFLAYESMLIHHSTLRKLLNQKMMDAWKIASIDNPPDEEIIKIIEKILSLKSDGFTRDWKNLTDKINYCCNSAYEYQIEAHTLLQTISFLLEKNTWLDPSSQIAVQKLQETLASAKNAEPKLVYITLQKKAEELLKPGRKQLTKEMNDFCKAIVETDLIALETYRTKISVKPLEHWAPQEIWGNQKLIPVLVESEKLSQKEAEFSNVIDIYLQALTAGSVAANVILKIQSLMGALKPLEHEITKLEETIRWQQKKLDTKYLRVEEQYKQSMIEHPDLDKDFITPNYKFKKRELKYEKMNLEALKNELHEKNKNYNSLLIRHKHEIKRCIILSQLAGHLEQQYHLYAKQAIQSRFPAQPDESNAFLVEQLRKPTIIKMETLPERLNYCLNQNFIYKMTYQSFNKKILNLAERTNWLEIHPNEGVISIREILTESGLSPEKSFKQIQKIAAALLKKSNSFFGAKALPAEVNSFYKAIIDKDITLIEKLNLHFDFPDENAQYLKVDI